jgi:hypothetical protein
MARTTLLSPRRYLRQGYGLALPSDFSLSTLRSTLIRAQAEVDRYCNVPKQPNPWSWLGGTMTDERQQWKLVNPLAYGPGARRTYLNAGPIKTVSDFHLDLGLTYLVQILPPNIYVNSMEQYIEIVALNPVIIAYYPLAVSLGLYNPIARVTYDYGWSFPVEGDILEAETTTSFSASYGNWDTTVIPVVYLDDVVQASGYTVDYNDGVINFTVAPDPGVEVAVDYTYLAPDPVVQAVGITATADLGAARMAQRGMTGLQSIKVAEVALTALQPTQMVTKNGATIPATAASLLDGAYTFGSVF